MQRPPHTLRFAVIATDTVALTIKNGELSVLLVPMTNPHYTGMLGLPGGLIAPHETADVAACRHLVHKGGLKTKYFDQLYTFSRVDRDPRGRVVAVAYLALVPENAATLSVANAAWVTVRKLPRLAYDHAEIISVAVQRLRARLEYTNIAMHLLPHEFTLTELQGLYETVLGRSFDKRNFRKKVLDLELVRPTGKKRTGGACRPAELYTSASRSVQVIDVI